MPDHGPMVTIAHNPAAIATWPRRGGAMAEALIIRGLAKKLAQYFVGFDPKKDVSANLFSGQSELRDMLFDSKHFNEAFEDAGIPVVLCKGCVRPEGDQVIAHC